MLKEVREVFEELYRRKNDFNKDYQPVVDGYTNFIFRDLNGNLMNSGRLNRTLKNIIDEYNRTEEAIALLEKRDPVPLPKITCHHLRHTFCTRIIESGVGIKTAQYWMGHRFAGTTLKIYLSVSENRNKEEMDKIEGMIKLR